MDRNRPPLRLVLPTTSSTHNWATRAHHRRSAIGQTQNQNLGAVDGLASRVERICDRAHNMLGHARIDLAGQLNETRMLTIFASLPCEIKWIDGDAMPAKPRAGIKRHETKWLRLGGFDDLPHVNSHGAVHEFQLID